MPAEAEVPEELRVRVVDLLAEVVLELEAEHGTAAIPYRDVHRIRRGEVDVPAEGAEGVFQALFLNSTEQDEDGVGYAWSGTSYHMLTHLTAEGVEAVSFKPWGQSDDPSSPHYADLTEWFARGEHKLFWYSRAEIEANQESREVLYWTP